MIKENVLSKINLASSTQFLVLTTIAVGAPLLQNQFITGSLVNATLFVAASVLNIQGAALICLLPSLIAISVGTLPSALSPLLFDIMIGNILLVTTFITLKNLNYWLRIVAASVVKFIFLFSISSLLINELFPEKLASNFLIMMSWPQLITALIGGSLAYFITKKYGHNN